MLKPTTMLRRHAAIASPTLVLMRHVILGDQRKQWGVVWKALLFAARYHDGQLRKCRQVPFLIHPIGVAALLATYNCPLEVVIAGLLHDLAEDVGWHLLEEIERWFGKRVRKLVEAVTDKDPTTSWEGRKLAKVELVRRTEDLHVLLLICADKIDNLRQIMQDAKVVGWGRAFSASKANYNEQRWYFTEMATALIHRLRGSEYYPMALELQWSTKKVFRDDVTFFG